MATDGLTIEFDSRAFTRWTRDLTRGMERNAAEKTLKGIAFEFTSRVMARNPVDKGRSRAAWTPFLKRINFPSGGLVRAGAGAGPEFSPEAVRQGESEGSVNFDLNGPKQSITITNAVPYIASLEFGSSDQAQAGMVRITMRELKAGSRMTKKLRDELEDQIAKSNRRAR